VATSSSYGSTSRGIIIAQQHPLRGAIHRAAFSIARHFPSRGIFYRAGSSSRGILMDANPNHAAVLRK
jgi:hypothetical protein